MEEKKKEGQELLINCVLCDATGVKEEVLQAYKQITINAAMVLVSPESAALLHRYPVSLNTTNVYTVPDGCAASVHNGSYTLAGNTAPEHPVALVVNGALTIEPDAEEALKRYPVIVVNGSVTCPESLSGMLGQLQVSGQSTFYPDGAILLKRTFVVDRVFVLRAKRADYFAQKRVVLTDCTLDVPALVEKGVRFLTQQAIVAEPLLEAALPLFGDEVKIQTVPAGCTFVNDDLTLHAAALRKYGSRLYVNGDLTLEPGSQDVLGQVEYLYVNGCVMLPASLEEAFDALDAEYQERKVIRGRRIADRPRARVERNMLEEKDGVSVYDCAEVTLAPDIPAQLILEDLDIQDCAQVNCTPEQRGAVEQVCQNVAGIQDGTEESEGNSLGGLLKDVFSGRKKMVNAVSYQL